MTSDTPDRAKRRLLMLAAGAPLAVLASKVARGEALVPLTADDPAAKALGYHADAASVDANAFTEFEPDRRCANCARFQGRAGDASGGCAIFPGKAVAAIGWCRLWAAAR